VVFEEATLIEPLGCAIRGMKRTGIQPGDTVLVIGVGVSGLLFIQLSRLWGASQVFAADLVEYRLQRALEAGVEAAINPVDEDLESTVRSLTGGVGPDLVIVTAGNRRVMEEAVGLAAKGGTVQFYAPLPPGETISVDVHELLFFEKTLVSTYSCGPDDTQVALEFISSGRVQTGNLVTHRFGLDEVGEAMRLAGEAGESMKVVIVP
jgi:L-iditol 2-dehydrogenase